ncbi:MAG: hypothetical protein IKD43_00920 [Clostridia bacterium]|nr:hypothetical protein [Clostridia bacterium]
MKQLLRSTTAYKLFVADAMCASTAHTTLIVFPDEKYLRMLLKECAKAFFLAKEGSRVEALIERESFQDCMILPAMGEKLTADTASALIEESALRPLEGDKKLFVLDAFENVTPLVQNKLLKVLEEPPRGVYFLLGATAEHALLPTVLSRAKRYVVPPFSEEAIEGALKRGRVQGAELREAAAASGGIYSVAESLLAGGGEEFRLAEAFLAQRDVEKLCRALGERKEGKAFLAAVKLVLRDLMLLAAGQEHYCARKTAEMQRLAAEYPVGALLAAIGFVTDAERELQFNANVGQAALVLALRIREEKIKWQKLL